MIFVLLLIVLVTAFYFIKSQYSYWEKYGIASIKPSIPFGNLQSFVKKENSFGLALYDIYKQTTEPFIGIYLFFRPAILIRDAELAKNILVNDFQHFHDRGVYCEPKTDPMSATLIGLPGEQWKNLRVQLTAAFSSGKIKGMFANISNVGKELVKVTERLAESGEIVEIRNITSRYVADCLALIAFGLDGVSTLNNPQHEFLTNAKKTNDSSKLVNNVRRALTLLCPKLLKYLGLKSMPQYMQDYCLRLVTETIKKRESNGGIYKDLMQYLLQVRNNNTTDNTDEWNVKLSAINDKSMSYEQMAGQVFIFYLAGNQSTASAIAYTLYELTQNDDLMKRAQEDIKQTLQLHDGEVSYQSIMDMKFIDLCLKETLRKYPFPLLNRECTKDYTIHGTDTVIRKGTPIIISVLGIHRDEQYFPEPEKYNPDRFNAADNVDIYMPFGLGPRNCIAFRMGLLIAKVAIVTFLMNFKIEAVSKNEVQFDIGSISLIPKAGQCKVKFSRI